MSEEQISPAGEVEAVHKDIVIIDNGNSVPVAAGNLTYNDMLARAMAMGDAQFCRDMLALRKEWQTQEMEFQKERDAMAARKAFNAAIAAARAEITVIPKNRHVKYKNKGGDETSYWHEDLAAIAIVIDPVFARHGLTYDWEPHVAINEPITVTCYLRHKDGHFTKTTLSTGADSSGGKNSIQAMLSAITYLQRATLKLAAGLAASRDDDGASAEPAAPNGETISEKEIEELQNLVSKTETDINRFLAHAKVPSLSDIAARDLPYLKGKLATKAKEMGVKI